MIRAIDLFCGIGGNSWGARESGIEIAAGFDIWQRAGDVYKTNFPEARFYLGDLSTYRHADILRMKDKIGEIDLLLASGMHQPQQRARGKPKKRKEFAPVMECLAFRAGFPAKVDGD